MEIPINKILNGDCIEHLKELPDNSVDAIITDPPYFFGSIIKRFGSVDSAEAQFGNDGSFNRLSKGFMGKQWDGFKDLYEFQVFSKKWATECLRVLKPGAYLLSFGGTRTYHRMACGIEDAGFEIRDCIGWIYGSGFPKSLNIGKQIDKLQGNKREVIGYAERFGREGRKANCGFKNEYVAGHEGTQNTSALKPIEMPISEQAKQWEGWGTALKPAWESIVVARKPLSEKNVALNVLKWGTGGINIDECRINYVNDDDRSGWHKTGADGSKGFNGENTFKIRPISAEEIQERTSQGRFPANIIHDGSDEVLINFPDVDEDDLIPEIQIDLFGNKINKPLINASRFFYCAKAGKFERNEGCEKLELKSTGHGNLQNSKGMERFDTYNNNNNHPTIKPVKLMEYLIKLVSKEGALILDPFLGSGTTAIACVKTNRNYIGIEKEQEYIKIAEARINHYLEQKKLKDFQ